MKTKFLTTLMIFASVLLFVGCDSADEDDLVGTWKTTMTEDDGQGGTIVLDVIVDIKSNGDYTFTVEYMGAPMASESGTWKVTDGTLLLTDAEGVESSQEYTLNGDTLTILDDTGNMVFTRQ